MKYFLPAFFLLFFGVLLYRDYRMKGDMKRLLMGIFLIMGGVVLSIFLRSMMVYIPLMILHLVAMLFYWIGVGLYLVKDKIVLLLLLAPLSTLALFFGIAWSIGGG